MLKTLLGVATLALVVTQPGGAGQSAAPRPSADAFTVLDPVPEGPRITPYLAYQTAMAWDQDDVRRERLAAVRTEDDVAHLQAELRAKLLEAIGGLPTEKTPLNAEVTGRIQMEGFRIEKVIFESLPSIYVTALVYVPEQTAGPHPAVLVPCGHSANGKAYYQALAQRLVQRGYVVICWDPVGQGERSQFWDAVSGKSRYNRICGEHAVLGNLAYLAGANLARWEVWDGIRALDYLLTRTEVDPARISITGTSGGGFQAAFIGALDARIKTIAPSCYITALPMRVFNRIFEDPDSDPEQDPFGMISEGIDHPGLLLLMYPRPVFIAAAVLDFFPIEGTRKTFREVSAVYRRLGQADRIAMTEGYHKHSYSDENQQAAIAFLDRFNELPAAAGLPPVKQLDERALWCTRSGQVLLDHPDGRSLVDDIRDYYRARKDHHAGRTLETLYYGDRYPGIRNWPVSQYAGSDAGRQTIAWEARGTSKAGTLAIDKYVLHHSGGLRMPLLHIRKATGEGSRRTVLLVSDDGKATDWDDISARVLAGEDVVTFDSRGLGETRMQYRAESVDDPTLAQADPEAAYFSQLSGVLADYVYNSLLTGRPYHLQRIEDVEIASRFARQQLGAIDLSIAGAGDAYTLAHDAAAVLPGLRLQTREGSEPLSWAALVEHKTERWPIQYLLPEGAYVR
jgi:hypothetical protein